jgi:hypothetical protein
MQNKEFANAQSAQAMPLHLAAWNHRAARGIEVSIEGQLHAALLLAMRGTPSYLHAWKGWHVVAGIRNPRSKLVAAASLYQACHKPCGIHPPFILV